MSPEEYEAQREKRSEKFDQEELSKAISSLPSDKFDAFLIAWAAEDPKANEFIELLVGRIKNMPKAKVILFKDSGKYYTEEEWQIPKSAIGPWDMRNSPDFRRIGTGKVLVETQEPWGYPHLL